MIARKARTPIVLDTNVFVRFFKARSRHSASRRVVRLWLFEKRLQLVVSPEVLSEYLEIFSDVVGLEDENIQEWRSVLRRMTGARS